MPQASLPPQSSPPPSTSLQKPPLEKFTGQVIAQVRVEGLGRTETHVVLRELLFVPGDVLVPARVAASLQRLKNLRIFRDAQAYAEVSPAGELTVVVNVEERWTIIPVTRFGGGGGSAFFVVGLYDLNLLGRYLDVGAQYENFNGIHGGVAWYRDPRLFDERQKLTVEVGAQGRSRAVYSGEESVLKGAYVQRRRRVTLALDREFLPGLTLGLGTELADDRFSSQLLTAAELRANARTGFRLPASARTVLVQGRVSLGGLDLDEALVRGVQLDLRLDLAKPILRSERDYHRATAQLLAFETLPFQQNIGLRLGLGTTNAVELPDRFFLGGLEHVRGFRDGEFVGRKAWYANAEYRVPSVRLRHFLLQHVIFADAGDVAEDWRGLRPFHRRAPRSAGAGLRFMAPSVARLNARLDYAFALSRSHGQGLVFGMQQFF